MLRRKKARGRKNERGVVITLVAVCLLGFIGAMAALSVDVVTLYTARSEAQLAVDAAALAGARVLANSGATSDPTAVGDGLWGNAETLAEKVARHVAEQNIVGGVNLVTGNITITFALPAAGTANPTIKVVVKKTDLPTFFARIWGSTTNTVAASATAEAYNPSLVQQTSPPGVPVAPLCVKPWLLPNISPTTAGGPIFTAATGAIADTTLQGWTSAATTMNAVCTNCAAPPVPAPAVWKYYPGTTDAAGSFPAPGASSCNGCTGFTDFQLSIAGCVQTPISCNSQVNVNINSNPNRNIDAANAINALTNALAGGDTVDPSITTPPPPGNQAFEFLPGAGNPVLLSAPPGTISSTTDIMVSNSLVTVPVIDTTTAAVWPGTYPNNVQIIGFLQLFLSPTGAPVATAGPTAGQIQTEVINLVGCGDGVGEATGTPILGNGASPVAVRLISKTGG